MFLKTRNYDEHDGITAIMVRLLINGHHLLGKNGQNTGILKTLGMIDHAKFRMLGKYEIVDYLLCCHHIIKVKTISCDYV